jgi:hypothetical protein
MFVVRAHGRTSVGAVRYTRAVSDEVIELLLTEVALDKLGARGMFPPRRPSRFCATPMSSCGTLARPTPEADGC